MLAQLETFVRGLRPKVKFAVQEWHDVRLRKKAEAYPVQLSAQAVATLDALKKQITSLQVTIAQSNGSIRLRSLKIDYPKDETVFTVDSYFGFAFRSIDEAQALALTGRLPGPTPAQFF